MQSEKPLLSLCIPTYNREKYLRSSLDSLISQIGEQSEEVEIVISDNFSSDKTSAMASTLASKYPYIKYFRNSKNINDQNFPMALMRARGEFRRLVNDNLLHFPSSLNYQLELVRANRTTRPMIAFYNRPLSKHSKSELTSLSSFDAFVQAMGLWLTSISTFGIWENEIESLEDPFSACATKLWQVDTTMKLGLLPDRSFLICQKKLHENLQVSGKDLSYGIFDIFHTNFIGILQPHAGSLIQQGTIDTIEKKLLLSFFSDRIVDHRLNQKSFVWKDSEDLRDALHTVYRTKPYYWRFQVGLQVKLFQERFSRLITRVQ